MLLHFFSFVLGLGTEERKVTALKQHVYLNIYVLDL